MIFFFISGSRHFLAPLNRMKTNPKLLVIRTRPNRALHSCFDGLAKVGHEVERQRLTDDDPGFSQHPIDDFQC